MQRLAIPHNLCRKTDNTADNMFSGGKTLLEGNQENVQLSTEPNLQDILTDCEIQDQSDSLNPVTSTNQALHISSLYKYYASSLNNSSPVRPFQCYYCKEEYLYFTALYNHAHLKHKDSASHPRKCFICQELFVFTKEYHNHLSSNHQIKYPEAICDICLTTFLDTEELQNHLLSHPADYACKQCCIKFQSRDLLTLHQEYHNCSKDLTCNICAASFQSKFLQGLHSLRHRQIECPLALNENCSSITSELELINHFKEHHPFNDCSVMLETIQSYDKEENALDELLQYETNISLHSHQVHYKSWLSRVKLKQDFQCSTCSIQLTSVFQLCIHFLKIHTNTNKCPYCGKPFKESYHILFHLGSKRCKAKSAVTPLTCSLCEETFHEEHKLLEHQLTHVKPLQCSECNAVFQKTTELKSHLQGHGVLPEFPDPVFVCPVCSSQWPTITHLRRHICTHAENRPFQCEHCGATFKRKQALRTHCLSAHSEKNHACPHCNNTFRCKQALFLHVCRVHVRMRRFVCGLCAKPWPQNQDLRRHLRSVHKVEYPPLKSSPAGSFRSVHVIPPIEDLAEGDPLRMKIAAIIQVEHEKLKSLDTDLVFTLEDANPETEISENSDHASNEAEPTAGKINFSCAFCDFQCEDLDVLIDHTGQHQQPSNTQSVNEFLTSQPASDHLVLNNPPVSDTLNNQPISDQQSFINQPIDTQQCFNSDQLAFNSQIVSDQQALNSQSVLDFTVVPVVPVQLIFLSPMIPFNYGTLVTVIPTPDNLTTINEPYIPITEQPIVVPEILNNSVLPSNEETIDSGELININGMFIRIEQCDGDASEIMRNTAGPSISIESCSLTESGATESALTENGAGGNEFQVSEKMPEKVNERIENTVRPTGVETVVQLGQDGFVPLEGPSDAQNSSAAGTGTGPGGTWSCQQCGKVVSTSNNLKRHMRVHSGERPFTCEVCGKTFTEKHNLNIHMRSHTQERPYACTICGKTMRYVKEFIEHNKKHQGVKDYSCSVCGRSFMRQRELVRHQLVHSSEKRYQCSECLKSFLRLDYLRLVHIPQVHGNFSCDLCKKRFQSEEKLEEHQRSHTHEGVYKERFTCPVCDKTFARKMGLKTHLQLHTNSKAGEAVRCYACPRKFATMETMLAHLGKFHKKWRDDIEEKKGVMEVQNVSTAVEAENLTGEVYIDSTQNIFSGDNQNVCVIVPQ